MPKLETDGFKRFWPMKQHMGTDKQGRRMYRECFVDMTNGEISSGGVDPETGKDKGWNGKPEGIPEGNVHSASERYRQNFDLIRWGKDA